MLQKLNRFSVLLLYPEYMNHGGNETYYAHVNAVDAKTSVDVAQQEAVAAQGDGDGIAPVDFIPLLVLRGHIEAEIFGREIV